MPRISAATNAAQRENTKRAILESFGKLLYSRGLPGLTMTDVAKNAGIGRTAVYNYFADMGELLVAYALDETERFIKELDEGLEGVDNPIDQLAVYIRLQIEDLARRHLPPRAGHAFHAFPRILRETRQARAGAADGTGKHPLSGHRRTLHPRKRHQGTSDARTRFALLQCRAHRRRPRRRHP